MAHVILQSCCNDASCVPVCPVDCIHPTPDEPGFMTAEMLHINPDECIDCGACIDECPVSAISRDDELTDEQEVYLDLNADYFDPDGEDAGSGGFHREPPRPWRKNDFSGLRVAIVGSGPSAFYTAIELIALKAARVEMFERLLTPYGLVRFGVAPDHQTTKGVTDLFRTLGNKPAFHLNLGVEVGEHVTHAELTDHFDAVVYAVGASRDGALDIPGEDLPGSHSATEFVSWYNGHPDFRDRTFDLSGEHAVIVGNGNVALDVARILLSDPEDLAATDIADHALEALRAGNVRTVTVLGRRGVAQAAYTNPEFLALTSMPDVEVILDPDEIDADGVTDEILDDEQTGSKVRMKIVFAREVLDEPTGPRAKKLIMRYLSSPTEITGAGRVESLRIARNGLERDTDGALRAIPTGETDSVDCGILFRSVGYRGSPVPGLPFDDVRGVIPNDDGRVTTTDGEVVPRTYVTGWIKRGPSGVIGTNKKCATDTVDHLLQDYLEDELETPRGAVEEFADLVRLRAPAALDFEDWRRIDNAERRAGAERGSSRVKLIDPDSMMNIVRARVSS